MQKDSRILYKWWDAINFDMRMETWGRKESKDRKGWGIERWLERADRCRSAGRRRLWWGVKHLSVWEEKRNSEPGGWRGSYGTPRCALHYTFTMAIHCEAAHTDKHNLEVRPTPSSDYIETFLQKHKEWGALSISHRMAKYSKDKTHLARLGAQPQWC